MEATTEPPCLGLPGSEAKILALQARWASQTAMFLETDATYESIGDKVVNSIPALVGDGASQFELLEESVNEADLFIASRLDWYVGQCGQGEPSETNATSAVCLTSNDQSQPGCTAGCVWCKGESKMEVKAGTVIDRTSEIGNQPVIKHVGMFRNIDTGLFYLFVDDQVQDEVQVPESDVFLFENEDGEGEFEIHYHSTIIDRPEYVAAIEKNWLVHTCKTCNQRYQCYEASIEYCGDCLKGASDATND